GLRYAGSRGALPSGAAVDAVPVAQGGISGGRAGFAYVADARDFGSFRLLGGLLRDNVRVRTAHQPFTAATANGDVAFGHGAVVIPVAGQTLDAEALQAKVLARAQEAGVTVYALASGRAASGIDLGSDNVRVLRTPSIALVMGEGVSATEIGSTWFSLDTSLGLPSSKLDPAQLASVDLARYTSIVFSGGTYANVSDAGVAALKRWIAAGGSLVVYGSGARWAIDKGLAEAKLREGDKKDEAERLDFGTVRDVFALGRVSGNILSADIDPTHPLGFGVQQRRIWVNKEGGLVFEPVKNAFLNVVNIDREPVVNGYLSDANRARVAGSSYLQVVPTGSGNVVLFADDPAHRKYWHGTERLLLNALLQANHLSTPRQRGE
ncbi:MAG TPA: peptidase M14, partial [Stenotrophomonas sp.]